MNLVERWFGHLYNKAVKRGVFLMVAHLQASIAAFLTAWNERPQPFVWTATVESIQEKFSRCRRTLEQIQPRLHQPDISKTAVYFADTTPALFPVSFARRCIGIGPCGNSHSTVLPCEATIIQLPFCFTNTSVQRVLPVMSLPLYVPLSLLE
jgi:hypothetical protein